MYWKIFWVIIVALLAYVTNFFIAPWLLSSSQVQDDNTDTLVLLHVLFRHGDRSPDHSEVYPKDLHAKHGFAPIGYGQLTKKGKRREYLIGKALREKYGRFLGLYVPDTVIAKSTDYVRTRMSCLLVLAGLYPPTSEQLWENSILWQPIPYDYEAYNQDKILGDPVRHCQAFKSFYEDFLLSAKGGEFYNNNTEIYNYLSEHTGWHIRTPKLVYDLYFLLKAEEEMGLELPEWTKHVWPKDITTLAADEYDAQTTTDEMLRIAAGYFLETILNTTDLKLKDELSHAPKIYLYSAHEYNIAFLLKALGLFKPHIPPFGSYVTFEVHKIQGIYGFKILYQDYESSSSEPRLLNLPNCDVFCSIEKFKKLMEKYIPLPGDCEDY